MIIPRIKLTVTFEDNLKTKDLFVIRSSKDLSHVLHKIWPPDTLIHHETFIILFINSANRVLGYQQISSGGITGTIADIRMIFQYIFNVNATCFAVAHNHPSGNLKPSSQDEKLTDKIQNAAKLLEITLIDHIIITDTEEDYFSFADEGLL